MLRGSFHTAKDLLAGALESTGLLWRQVDRRLRGRVLVLMYHRVLPLQDRDSFSAPGIIVTPETFDRHLGWIRAHLHPMTPTEFGEVQQSRRPLPERACLVTFDDGWQDNFTHALPALQRHDVPALLFTATGFIGTRDCFWQERLGRLLYTAWQAGSRGSTVLERAGVESALKQDSPIAREHIRDAVNLYKSRSPEQIESLLRQFERMLQGIGVGLPSDFGDDGFLSWSELETLTASSLVTVGSHAVSHSSLPRLAPDARRFELSQSRAELEEQLDCKVDWFAYPNGDHDADSAADVRASGYRGAFTTEDGPVAPGDDAFALRRVNMHEGATRTLGRFLARLTGTL